MHEYSSHCVHLNLTYIEALHLVNTHLLSTLRESNVSSRLSSAWPFNPRAREPSLWLIAQARPTSLWAHEHKLVGWAEPTSSYFLNVFIFFGKFSYFFTSLRAMNFGSWDWTPARLGFGLGIWRVRAAHEPFDPFDISIHTKTYQQAIGIDHELSVTWSYFGETIGAEKGRFYVFLVNSNWRVC